MSKKKPEQINSNYDLHQIKTSSCEIRSTDGEQSRMVEGYSVKWGEMSELLWGDFYEIIEKYAITQEVIDNSDILIVWNHNRSEIPLARKKKGKSNDESTLRLFIDEIGLRYEADIAKTTAGDDLLEALRRGDVEGVSLAFIPEYDSIKWEDLGEYYLRRVFKIEEIFDISPTSYPCYECSTISNRSKDMLNRQKSRELEERAKDKARIEAEIRDRELEIIEIDL